MANLGTALGVTVEEVQVVESLPMLSLGQRRKGVASVRVLAPDPKLVASFG
jgi:hypothetical protein